MVVAERASQEMVRMLASSSYTEIPVAVEFLNAVCRMGE